MSRRKREPLNHLISPKSGLLLSDFVKNYTHKEEVNAFGENKISSSETVETYIRQKMHFHTTEKLFPYVCSQIFIRDEVEIYSYDHKSRKINHYINRIENKRNRFIQYKKTKESAKPFVLISLVCMMTDRTEQRKQYEKQKISIPKGILAKGLGVKNNLNKASSKLVIE